MLSDIMLNVANDAFMLSVVVPNVIMLVVVMLVIVMLVVVMLVVVMMVVVMLSVIGAFRNRHDDNDSKKFAKSFLCVNSPCPHLFTNPAQVFKANYYNTLISVNCYRSIIRKHVFQDRILLSKSYICWQGKVLVLRVEILERVRTSLAAKH